MIRTLKHAKRLRRSHEHGCGAAEIGYWGAVEHNPELWIRCRTVPKSGLERIWGFMPPRPAPAMNLWATTRCIYPVRR
jgi:hypothetical protein